MKKLFTSVLLVLGILLSMTSCGFKSSVPVTAEVVRPTPAAVQAASPEVSLSPVVSEPPAEVQAPEVSEPPALSVAPSQNVFHAETHFPAPTEAPVQNSFHAETDFPAVSEHVHTWASVTATVHHDAVTEQVKVIDQPGTEGHYEGGAYPVVVCRCGAEFTSGDEFLAHQRAAESLDLHGGYTSSVRSNQVWVEGTPEVSHYETVVVSDAWDEEIVTGEVCTSCGAVR